MILKIKSITDVITNSSTEVYMVRLTDTTEERLKSLSSLGCHIFRTEEDVKNYFVSLFEDVLNGNWNDDLYDILDSEFLQEEINCDISDIVSYTSLQAILEKSGKTAEEVYDFFSFIFKAFVGYCYISFCNHYVSDDERYELDKLMADGLVGKKYYI